MNKGDEVQNQFLGWYASMSFQQDAELTKKRFAAIESHVEGCTTSSLILLARVAFRLNLQMGSAEIAALRQQFAGNTTQPGDDELTLLSASALAVAMESNKDAISVLAATVVSCMSCGGMRELKQPMDLVGQADNVLRKLSETSRRRPSLEQTKFSTPTIDKSDEALAQAGMTGDILKVAQAIVTLTNKTLSTMARRQREFESAVQRYVLIQDEELDILWWLEGGHSFDLGLNFPEVVPEHLPLAMAMELGRLTKVLPGPPAVASLLSRTGLMIEPRQSLPDAIQGMSRAWLDKSVDGLETTHISAAVTPIIFALQRRHEVHGENHWIAAWCTTTGLPREAQLSPLQLAVAAYREFTLVRLG